MLLSKRSSHWLKKVELDRGGQGLFDNRDNLPVPPEKQTWTRTTFLQVYACTNFSITTWTSGSMLLNLGLTVWQAMVTATIATILGTAAMYFVGLIGTDYRISGPFANRVVWGFRGFSVLLLVQLIGGVAWTAVQGYYAAMCLKTVIGALVPAFLAVSNTLHGGISTNDLICVLLFWAITYPLLCLSTESWKIPTRIASMSVAVTAVTLTTVCLVKARGVGPLFWDPYTLVGVEAPRGSKLAWAMVRGINAYVGTMGPIFQPTFTRFAKRPGYQVPALVLGAASSLCFTFMGIATTSAAVKIFPNENKLLWAPYDVLQAYLVGGGSGVRAAVFFAGLSFCSIQLGINVTTNCFQQAINISSVFPRWINARRGAFIVASAALMANPWRLADSPAALVQVLIGESILYAPAVGLLLADYYMVRHGRLDIQDLYKPDVESIYWYRGGFNPRAFAVYLAVFCPMLPGFVQTIASGRLNIPGGASRLYYLAWCYSMFASAFLYIVVCRVFPVPGFKAHARPNQENATPTQNILPIIDSQDLKHLESSV